VDKLNIQKVLLVEDDHSTQFMMAEMLDAVGVEFEVANDGQECIDKLGSDAARFDAVFLDIHMPRKSGLDALLEIHKRPSKEHSYYCIDRRYVMAQ